MRLGRFRVNADLVRGDTREARAVFAGFLPVRVEWLGIENVLECFGIHPQFDDLAEGMPALEYKVEIKASLGGPGVRFIRCA